MAEQFMIIYEMKGCISSGEQSLKLKTYIFFEGTFERTKGHNRLENITVATER